MNHRERTLAILNYQPYDRLPVVHFGYWTETLEKWAAEGHVTKAQASGWRDGNAVDRVVSGRENVQYYCERMHAVFGG
jgi:uroporphyrinogen decarboxylase